MTDRQIDNRITQLLNLDAEIKELEEKAEDLRLALKCELELRDEEEHDTGRFLIRWKNIISSRLDTKRLKNERPELFAAYSVQSSSRRFSIV